MRRERMTILRVKLGLLLTLALTLLWVFAPDQHVREVKLPDDLSVHARHATMEEKRENKTTTREFARALGYSNKNINCLITLWTRESRFDHLAKNQHGSSAYGIAQLLGEKSNRAELQILRGIRYLGARYESDACRALRFHNRHNWYGGVMI
jgi:hypothetical protein